MLEWGLCGGVESETGVVWSGVGKLELGCVGEWEWEWNSWSWVFLFLFLGGRAMKPRCSINKKGMAKPREAWPTRLFAFLSMDGTEFGPVFFFFQGEDGFCRSSCLFLDRAP